MRKELGLQAQMPQGGACLAPLGALPPMLCTSVSKISSVPTVALRLFTELETQALYQRDLHAPMHSGIAFASDSGSDSSIASSRR